MPYVCPGRCNTLYRSGPDTPERADAYAVWGDPVWCPGCSGTIRSALRAMPTAYAALAAVPYMTPRPPSDELMTHVSGSRERPSPGPGVDLRHELSRTLCSWEDDMRSYLHSRAAPMPDGSGEALTAAVHYLNMNFERMMGRAECAQDFGQEVLHLFQAVLRMVKNGPSRRKLHIPCPRCDVRALVQHEGIAGQPWYTECVRSTWNGCGAFFTEQEMTWAVEVRMAVRTRG